MMDFSLEHNDLEISNGDICLCPSNVEATAQLIAIRLKTMAGEWFLDANIGLPYLTQVLGKKRNDRFLKGLITKEIQAVADVKELSHFSFDEGESLRSITINFHAKLSDQSVISIRESIGV
jgi:hypothetical protein